MHLTRIRFQKTLKYGIVGNQVRIHLDQVFFIEFQSRVTFLNRISCFIITLNKLPQLITLPVIRILHHQVGSLNRASHHGTARHQFTEGAGPQRTCHTAHTIDSFEDIHIVTVILSKTLTVLDRHLNLIGNLFISIIYFTFHAHGIADLISGGPEDYIRTFIYEGKQTLNQMVYKPILIQVVALFCGHIQNPRRLNIPFFVRSYKLCIHAQMPHAVCGNLLGQSHRHHLF